MKRLIKAATGTVNQLPITGLTGDELAGLPDKITCFTQAANYYIGSTTDGYKFKIISNDAIRNNPDKCWLDATGSYIAGDDIYLAAKSSIEAAESEEIDNIKSQYRLLKRYAL